MISVHPAKPDEWRTYRDVRLRALLDSPDAFGSTYEAEAARTDAMWSMRIAAATSFDRDRLFFAFNGKEACGLVWCKLSPHDLTVANVFQMWVDPSSRGMGVGRALLEKAVSWAKSLAVSRVCLGITAGNTPAMRLYVAFGFRPVDALEPLRDGSDLMVQSMSLVLGRPQDNRP